MTNGIDGDDDENDDDDYERETERELQTESDQRRRTETEKQRQTEVYVCRLAFNILEHLYTVMEHIMCVVLSANLLKTVCSFLFSWLTFQSIYFRMNIIRRKRYMREKQIQRHHAYTVVESQLRMEKSLFIK